jgi:hypothetical protein
VNRFEGFAEEGAHCTTLSKVTMTWRRSPAVIVGTQGRGVRRLGQEAVRCRWESWEGDSGACSWTKVAAHDEVLSGGFSKRTAAGRHGHKADRVASRADELCGSGRNLCRLSQRRTGSEVGCHRRGAH